MTSITVCADSVDSTIQARIDELYSRIGNKYFTTDGAACNNGNSCFSTHDHCRNSKVVQSEYFKSIFGFNLSSSSLFPPSPRCTAEANSCSGFASFAEWYIFRTSNSSSVKTNEGSKMPFEEPYVTSNAKIGDIISLSGYCYNSDGTPRYNTDGSRKKAGHEVIFISANSYGITVLDSNWGNGCKVSKHTIGYYYCDDFQIGRATTRGEITPPVIEAPSNPPNLKSDKTVYNSSESITLYWDSVLEATHYWIYMWKDGVQLYGTDIGNTTSFTSSPTAPGNYTFIVRAGNSVGYSEGVSYNFTVTDIPVTNAWIKTDKYNIAINKEVVFTYHADNADHYDLWLFRNGVCLGSTSIPLTGSYTTKFDAAGYYQAYITSSNSSGYIDSGKIEFNIYDNVPPDPWIYVEKNIIEVGEEVRFVYNASHVDYFSLGIDNNDERIISAYRGWNETSYATSFDTPGIYSAYISAYNDYGYADSRRISFTVIDKTIQNLGEYFYGKILNKECWMPLKKDNSQLKLCEEQGPSNELWRFVKQADGSYEIFSCASGECLIANSESEILIGTTTENANKPWFIYNFGNGIVIKPKCSENVLTLDGGNAEAGTEIILSPFSGNSSQIFSVYQGSDVQLAAPIMTIDTIKYDKVLFNWSAVPSLSNYKIKVYSAEDLNNPIYVDDVSIDTTSYALKLPTGNYVASVTAYNYYQGCQSNEMRFNLTTPISTNVIRKDSTLIFTSLLNVNETENTTVILGLYDKNNRMLNIVKAVYENTVVFNVPYQKDIEYAKVMVWDSLSGLTPLCEAEIIPSSEFIVE